MPKELVNTLCRPGVIHPSGISNVVETHISWVLLTGDFAYKIKKPVNLGFVDFSTLESRKNYCEEEIRLNRRLAPSIYLGIVPITGSTAHPQLNGSGPVLEYAVKMQQFNVENELSHLIRSDIDFHSLFQNFCIDLAGFHQSAPAAPTDGDYATFDIISASAMDNFESIHLSVTDKRELEALTGLQQWTEHTLQEKADRFEIRRTNGKIRECHGDLHLGNLVCIDSKIVAFDCLEFNPQFRWIDVASELAFLLMDLHAWGKPGLARRCLDWYLEETCDYDLVSVLRHYLVYRAMVRAKVSMLTARDKPDNSRIPDFGNYLSLARYFTAPQSPPQLIITHGFSGSGKTWIADKIVELASCIRIRSDVVRKILHGIPVRDSSRSEPGAKIYTPEANRKTFEFIETSTRNILNEGYSVIVDATFLKKKDRLRFRKLAGSIGIEFHIVDIITSTDILRQRIARRKATGTDASEADQSILDLQMRYAEPLDTDEKRLSVTVDTSQDEIDICWLAKQINLRKN